MTTSMRKRWRSATRSPPRLLVAGRCRAPSGASGCCRSGADGGPHWNCQGCTGWSPSRCSCPCQLGGTDGRPGDADHERQRATTFPGASCLRALTNPQISNSQASAPYREVDIRISAGSTIEILTALPALAGVARSIVLYKSPGSRIDARDPWIRDPLRRPEDLKGIPTRRVSMFDFIRAAPGISPTSPSSGTATTVSAFGSGTNENQFLIDGDELHLPVQRRRTLRTGHRLHPGSACSVDRCVSRVRQRPGRGRQCHYQAGQQTGFCLTRRTSRRRPA